MAKNDKKEPVFSDQELDERIEPVTFDLDHVPVLEVDTTKEEPVKINSVGLNTGFKIPVCPVCHFEYPDEILGNEITCKNCANKVKTV